MHEPASFPVAQSPCHHTLPCRDFFQLTVSLQDFLKKTDPKSPQSNWHMTGAQSMFELLKNLVRDAKGATAIEYGLILGLIFVAMMAGVSSLGGGVNGGWTTISNKVSSAA